MKKLSSKTTFLYKRIFPFIWFGFLAIMLCVGLLANLVGDGPGLMFVVVPIGLIVFGYGIIIRRLMF